MKKILIFMILIFVPLASNGYITSDTDFLSNFYKKNFKDIKINCDMIYINMALHLDKKDTDQIFTLSELENDVLKHDYRYLIDLSDIKSPLRLAKANKILGNTIPIKFNQPFLVIARHKDKLEFMPLSKKTINKKNLSLWINYASSPPISFNTMNFMNGNQEEDGEKLPHISFYIDMNNDIPSEYCTFNNNLYAQPFLSSPFSYLCNNPNLSIVYKITLERSLNSGTIGSATPDAKIVRISVDADSSGSGISLSNKLQEKENITKEGVSNIFGTFYSKEWIVGPIAEQYGFSVSTDNNKAIILKTEPYTNIDVDYRDTKTSTFTLGVGSGLNISKDGPRVSIDPSFSYNQTRMLNFDTKDYEINKYSNSKSEIEFSWIKKKFPDASDLLSKRVDVFWNESDPIDKHFINYISYSNFTPNFDIVYKADKTEKGDTTFYLNASVDITSYNVAAQENNYFPIFFTKYYATNNKDKLFIDKSSFIVNWKNPVFTGGYPVDIQIGSQDNSCLSINNNLKLNSSSCNIENIHQSFIYDQLKRYRWAADTDYCLDSTNMTSLIYCNPNLSQQWIWKKEENKLKNKFTGKYFSYSSKNNFFFTSDNSEDKRTEMMTYYTNIYK